MFITVFKKANQILTDCTYFLYCEYDVCLPRVRNVLGSQFLKQRGDAYLLPQRVVLLNHSVDWFPLCARARACVCAYVCAYARARMCVCVCVCVRACVRVCVNVQQVKMVL